MNGGTEQEGNGAGEKRKRLTPNDSHSKSEQKEDQNTKRNQQ